MKDFLKVLCLTVVCTLIMDFTLFGVESVFSIDIPLYVYGILAAIIGFYSDILYNKLFRSK